MREYILTESQLRELVIESTKTYLIKEGLWNNVKQGAKIAGLGALGTAGVATMDLANSELNNDAEPDPMELNLKQATDEFRHDNLMDKAKEGDITYQDAMDLYHNGKGYANESRKLIGKQLQTESFKKTIRRIIEQVIGEEL